MSLVAHVAAAVKDHHGRAAQRLAAVLVRYAQIHHLRLPLLARLAADAAPEQHDARTYRYRDRSNPVETHSPSSFFLICSCALRLAAMRPLMDAPASPPGPPLG